MKPASSGTRESLRVKQQGTKTKRKGSARKQRSLDNHYEVVNKDDGGLKTLQDVTTTLVTQVKELSSRIARLEKNPKKKNAAVLEGYQHNTYALFSAINNAALALILVHPIHPLTLPLMKSNKPTTIMIKMATIPSKHQQVTNSHKAMLRPLSLRNAISLMRSTSTIMRL